MFMIQQTARRGRRTVAGRHKVLPGRTLRSGMAAASLAALLSLSACGGGGDSGSAAFNVGVLVGGQAIGGGPLVPGRALNLAIRAGQSLELDASEPVVWTLEVGGSAVTGSDTTVYYAGASITVTALSPSRIALDTAAAFPLLDPVPIRLTATSTFDLAQVATVNVLITN